MQRTANARWQGTAKEGGGTLTTQSGTLKDTPYTFKMRFGDGKGTNPEELIAAAHAGCFTMALSFALNNAGFGITKIELRTEAEVPGIDEAAFKEQAETAKANCPVSKALAAVDITLDAKLVS